MKHRVLSVIIIALLFSASIPLISGGEDITDDNDEKTTVFIQGVSYQYKFGSFLHIGKIWWCPNHNIKLVFDVDDSFVFSIDGEKQTISTDRVSISMDGFFGIAPTLHSFLTSDTIRVYGVCDTINVTEKLSKK